jgi:UDP-N-acetylglucosamine 2-epimerase (non-hydrolysing)
VLAAAVAANAREVPLIHVEAGLRAFDRNMPEEHNRVIADHLSDLCLAPTDFNVGNLADEGITGDRVVLTGNPIIEAVERLLPTDGERAALLDRYGVDREEFILSSFHRPENVDTKEHLATILDALGSLPIPVVLPLHPRTSLRIAEFGLQALAEPIRITEPIGFRDFIGLGAESRMLISDSGGVQEEITVYKRPAVVVRRSTERQETMGIFARRIEPTDGLRDGLHEELAAAMGRREELLTTPSPYGDQDSPAHIVDAIRTFLAS